jgi:hypothetical protein
VISRQSLPISGLSGLEIKACDLCARVLNVCVLLARGFATEATDALKELQTQEATPVHPCAEIPPSTKRPAKSSSLNAHLLLVNIRLQAAVCKHTSAMREYEAAKGLCEKRACATREH